jgi:hypothetical protein
VPASDAPSDVAGVLASDRDGRCVFYARHEGESAAGGCEIHRTLGPAALPSACQHFPRECLIDPRGVSVTLSHYCPTAASLLFSHAGPVTIVEGPPVLTSGDPEGLDARDVLPPLLRPELLMDHAAYHAWETHLVKSLTSSDNEPEQVLMALDHDARTLCAWRLQDGALTDVIDALAAHIGRGTALDPDWACEQQLFASAVDSLVTHTWSEYPGHAEATWHQRVARGWRAHRQVINRFLAAHAFACWMAYEGSGVVSHITRLRLVLAVLRAESIRRCVHEDGELDARLLTHAIRQTDLLIVHLVDRARLAAQLGNASSLERKVCDNRPVIAGSELSLDRDARHGAGNP